MKQVHIDSIPATIAHETISRKAIVKVGELKSSIQTINWATLAPNQEFEPHTHPDCEEIYIFLEGSGTMVIDGNVIAVTPKTCIIVDVNESHSLKNNSNERLDYIAIRAKID